MERIDNIRDLDRNGWCDILSKANVNVFSVVSFA